jgi:hypothetical protein
MPATISDERLTAILFGILKERREPMDSVALSRLCGQADPASCFRALHGIEGVKITRSQAATVFEYVGA